MNSDSSHVLRERKHGLLWFGVADDKREDADVNSYEIGALLHALERNRW